MPHKVDPEAKSRIRQEIMRIALKAVSLGWTPELLWEEKFWNIKGVENRPGLIATMRPGDKIVEVTENYISIERSGVVTRFYHPDRPHPWIKKGDCHE